jgi:hypothetical protein
MSTNTIIVTKEEATQLRKEWLQEHAPRNGTDCVTPYDRYFYKDEFPITVDRATFEDHAEDYPPIY